MAIKGWVKAVWQHFPAVFILIMDIMFVVMILIEWDDPVYGFSHFGPIVFISALFPVIWLVLYVLGHNKGSQQISPTTATTNKSEPEESK